MPEEPKVTRPGFCLHRATMSGSVRTGWVVAQVSTLGVTPTMERALKSRFGSNLTVSLSRLGAMALLLTCAISRVVPSLGWRAT
jgi:hypothetical protein